MSADLKLTGHYGRLSLVGAGVILYTFELAPRKTMWGTVQKARGAITVTPASYLQENIRHGWKYCYKCSILTLWQWLESMDVDTELLLKMAAERGWQDYLVDVSNTDNPTYPD